MEEGNPATDRPNVHRPQDGDPEVGDHEGGEPETKYLEYNEIESKSTVPRVYLVRDFILFGVWTKYLAHIGAK